VLRSRAPSTLELLLDQPHQRKLVLPAPPPGTDVVDGADDVDAERSAGPGDPPGILGVPRPGRRRSAAAEVQVVKCWVMTFVAGAALLK